MSWVKYVYIDESGDLGKHGSKYFTVVAVIVDKPKILSRIMKRLRERKLKKKLRQLPEIKANNSNKQIREYVLNQVKVANCKIYAIVVEKSKIFDPLYNVKDKLYNYFCGKLFEWLNNVTGKLVIMIDKKHTNTLLRTDFNEYIEGKLATLSPGLIVEISHESSHSVPALQVVDFVAWSINRKFNSGDDSYFRIIEDKIANKEKMVLW